jgi:hypothetical protein
MWMHVRLLGSHVGGVLGFDVLSKMGGSEWQKGIEQKKK